MATILRPYEAVVILHPDTSIEDQKATFRKNAEIIKSYNGRMNHIDTWGKRNFCNAIKKSARGIYFHVTFEADSQAIAELERVMRINEKVLRFQHSRLEDGTDLKKYVETYKETLTANAAKEREREAKFQAKKAARAAERAQM